MSQSKKTLDWRQKVIIFWILLLDIIGIAVFIPAFPELKVYYGITDFQVTMWLTIYSLFAFLAAPLLGQWSDKFGRKKTLVWCIVGTTLSYLVLLLTKHYWVFLVSRMINGITGGNISILQAILTDISPNEETKRKNFGLMGALFGLWFIIGPVLWSLFLKFGGVELIFLFGTIFALLEVWLLSFGFTNTNELTPKKHITYNSFGVMRKYLKHPLTREILISLCFLWIGWFAINATQSLYMNNMFGTTWQQYGYYLAIVGVMSALNLWFLVPKFWMKRFSHKWLIIFAHGALILWYTLVWMAHDLYTFLGLFYATIVLWNIYTPVYNIEVMSNAKRDEVGEISGMLGGAQSLFMFIGPLIWWLMLQFHYNTFFGAAVCCLISLVVIIPYVQKARDIPVNIKSMSVIMILWLLFVWGIWTQVRAEVQPSIALPAKQVQTMSVSQWDMVAVNYTLMDGSWKILDTNMSTTAKKAGIYEKTRPYKPMKFIIGDWSVIVWFEKWIVWMKTWQTKKIILSPEEAYGAYDADKVYTFDRDMFDGTGEITVWSVYNIGGMFAKVITVRGNQVTLDANHPLAWQQLTFLVTLKKLEKRVAVPQELVTFAQWTLSATAYDWLFVNQYGTWKKDGDITIIEYSDPACPFCIRQFRDHTLQKIRNTFAQKVYYMYKPVQWVNHDTTEQASYAILCAGQQWWEKAFTYMYENILSWSVNEPLSKNKIIWVAKSYFGDTKDIQSCMTKKTPKNIYENNWKEFQTFTSMPGTPTTIIIHNKKRTWIAIPWAYPYETFLAAMQAWLAQ